MKHLFDLVRRWTTVKRYSNNFSVKAEDIAQHTAVVCLLVHELASMVEDVDYKELYERAIYHDLDEIVLGDIPRTTKYASEDLLQAIKSLEDEAVREVCSVSLGEDIYEVWRRAKSGRLGYLIKIADMVSVAIKAWEEVACYGNRAFLEVVINVRHYLEDIKQGLPEYFSSDEVSRLEGFIDGVVEVLDEIVVDG